MAMLLPTVLGFGLLLVMQAIPEHTDIREYLVTG